MTMDIFRIILLAYVGYLLLIRLCSQGNIERMLTVTTLVNAGQNVLIIIFQILAIVMPISSEKSFTELPENFLLESSVSQYYYMQDIAFWYQQKFVLEAFSLMFIGYKLAMVFRISRSIDIFMQSIERVWSIMFRDF